MAQLNHFKIWKIGTKKFQRGVTLLGQFDKETRQDAVIEAAEWLANPVNKNGEGVPNPEQHLVGYFLKPPAKPAPKRWVVLSNQFHPEKAETMWHLGNPVALLVPASKVYEGQPPAPPTGIDHFECYVVEGAKGFPQPVVLEDQFDVKLKKPEKISDLLPVFFAVPVSKDLGPITNPQAHLAIYDITPKTIGGKPPIKVITRDQFGVLELQVEESILLAVPSLKLKWAVG
jgi:hypothetical protein